MISLPHTGLDMLTTGPILNQISCSQIQWERLPDSVYGRLLLSGA